MPDFPIPPPPPLPEPHFLVSDLERGIALVRDRLESARNVMVITGAGISAESGIPTFRTNQGLWDKFNPLDHATREAFLRDPVRIWQWYADRRANAAAAKPNAAHIALARLEASGRRVFIVTQNVDDLHEQAGSREVVHVHGSLWRLRCERDGTVLDNREVPMAELPPTCMCGAIMRPDVVWFGENLPWQPVEAVSHYLLEGDIDLCLVIGTEASFGYIVNWAAQARDIGALLVDVNPHDTGLGLFVDVHLEGKAGDVMPELVPA